MSNGHLKVDEGSLAFALIAHFLHHQIDNGAVTQSNVETVLRNTVAGAGIPAAQASARQTLKRAFPDFDF